MLKPRRRSSGGGARWLLAAMVLVTVIALSVGAATGQPTCTDRFTGPSGGDWSNAANWTTSTSTHSAPTSSDVACWSADTTVTVSAGTNNADSIQGGTLDVSGGYLTLGNASDGSSLVNLDITGGFLQGPSPLALTGAFTWDGTNSGSQIDDLPITQSGGGTASIFGSSQLYFSSGSFSTSSPISIDAGDFPGPSSVGITTTSTVTFGNISSGSQETITAAEIDTTGPDTLASSYAVKLTGTGTSTLDGSLTVLSLTTPASSTVTVASGATLTDATGTIDGTIAGAGTFANANTQGGPTIASGGGLTIANVTALAGTITVDSGATYAVGSATGAGTTIDGGSITLDNATASTGDLTMESGGDLGGSAALSVAGDFAWSDGNIDDDGGTVAISQTGGGTFDIDGSGLTYLLGGSIHTTSPVTISNENFTGSGSLTTTSTLTFAAGSYVNNGGTSVDLTAAGLVTPSTATTLQYTLTLTGTSSSLGGDVAIASLSTGTGATVTVPADHTLSVYNQGTEAGTITGPGTFAINEGPCDCEVDTSGVTFENGSTLSSDSVDVAAYTVDVSPQATYTVDGGTTVGAGTLEMDATGGATTGNLTITAGYFYGNGTLGVTGNFDWDSENGQSVFGNSANAPTVNQTGGGSFEFSGTTEEQFYGGAITTTSPVVVDNPDLVTAGSPTLTTTQTVTFDQASYDLNGGAAGTFSAAGFRFGSGVTSLSTPNFFLDQTGGTTTIPGSDSLTPGGTAFALKGGTLTDDGTLESGLTLTGGTLNGTGTVSGAVTNTAGTVAPGDGPGTLSLENGFTQAVNGTLAVQDDGTSAGQFSALDVTGSVQLAGTLAMQPSSAYASTATPGDTVAVIQDTGSRSGSFGSVTSTPSLQAGESYSEVDDDAAHEVQAVVGAAQPPANTSAPQITGTAQQGDQLSTTPGGWTNNPSSFTYQWEDCTTQAATSCANIGGATADTYTLTANDVGKYVTVVVTAHNAASGTGSAVGSPVKGPVTAVTAVTPPAPSDGSPPQISGTPAVGNTLTCEPGSWTGSPTFAYAWSRDGAAISGAGSASYTVSSADQGDTLTCVVTATNAGGSKSAESAGVSVPAASSTPPGGSGPGSGSHPPQSCHLPTQKGSGRVLISGLTPKPLCFYFKRFTVSTHQVTEREHKNGQTVVVKVSVPSKNGTMVRRVDKVSAELAHAPHRKVTILIVTPASTLAYLLGRATITRKARGKVDETYKLTWQTVTQLRVSRSSTLTLPASG